MAFWSQTINGGAYSVPSYPLAVTTTHFCKDNSNEETFDIYLQAKNEPHSSHFPWDIKSILQTSCFGYFGHDWLRTPKVIISNCQKLLHLSEGKKPTLSSTFFWRYCKDIQTSYYWHFGHAWLCTLNVIVSACRKFRCLSACQK